MEGLAGVHGASSLIQPRLPKNIWGLWWGEILSLVASAITFVAMVDLLWIYQHQPTSTWNSPISLNGVIAILSALFKAFLAFPFTAGLSHLKWSWFLDKERPLSDIDDFDKASRDPWGCFRFIFHQIGSKERPTLGLLGALGLILAIATETFAQATLEYYSCPHLSSKGTARIAKANLFGPSATDVLSVQTLDTDSQLAIYRGLLNPAPNSSLSNAANMDCLTGNCTFPHAGGDAATFATLAVCSSCVDITANLNRSKDEDGILFSLSSGARARIRNWPDPVMAMGITDFPVDPLAVKAGHWPLYTMDAVVLRQTNCTFEPDNPLCNNDTIRTQWENPSAASCSLTPCVKTYDASFENGVYSEKELSARYLRKPDITVNSGPYFYRLVTDPVLRDGVWSACNWTSERTTENVIEIYASEFSTCQQLNLDRGSCKEYTDTVWYPPRCVFGAGQAVGSNLQKELHLRLNNKTVETQNDTDIEDIEGEPYLRRLYLDNKTAPASVIFERLMAGLATELTARIRSHTSAAAFDHVEYTYGDVWSTEICYTVRWAWLAYLGVLLVLEIVFVLSVLVVTWSDGWRWDWKSSALPSLFHGLNEDMGIRNESPLSETKGMEEAAKRINVRLVQVDGEWRFVT